eukprot:7717934-Karenia_brevis.AAC.1
MEAKAASIPTYTPSPSPERQPAKPGPSRKVPVMRPPATAPPKHVSQEQRQALIETQLMAAKANAQAISAMAQAAADR